MPPKKGSKKKAAAPVEEKKVEEKKVEETKKDDKMDVEEETTSAYDGNVSGLLEAINGELVHELLEANQAKQAKNTARKKLAEKILETAQGKGEKLFFEALSDKKDVLRSAMEVFGEVDHDSKVRFTTDFKKKYSELGTEGFFNKMSEAILNKFCEALEFKEEGGKDDLVSGLKEELQVRGLIELFNGMNKEFAVETAKSLKINHSGSKKALVYRIVGQAYSYLLEEAEKESKKEKKEKKDKPAVEKKDIKKGVTFEDLYQYYREELTEFCKKNGLKITGTKKETVKRILAFLDGDVEGTKPQKPGESKKKRRRPAGAADKKRKPKKAAEGETKDKGSKKRKRADDDKADEEKDAKKQKTK